MKTEYKELSFVPKCKGYFLRHKHEQDIFNKYLDQEAQVKFFEMLLDLDKNKNFRIQSCMIRIVRAFQIIGLVLVLATLGLMVMAYMGKTKETAKLEQCYLAFCATCIFIFLTIFISFILDNCVIQKQIDQIKKYLKERISDLFPTFNYTLEMNTYQVITIKPLTYDEGKPLIIGGNDYFEYIKDNKPDAEGFYSKTNPFDLDPHEKNFAKIIIEERRQGQLQAEKKARKDKMLKGFGGKVGAQINNNKLENKLDKGAKFAPNNKMNFKNDTNKLVVDKLG